MKITILFFLLGFIVFSGCDKPGPIELVDNTLQDNSVEIDTTSDIESLNSNEPVIDSSGFFASTGGKVFGQVIVAGALFDGGDVQHEASLAQAIFFNRNQPVVFNGDTVAYRTLNAGDVRVNGLLVTRYTKRLTLTLSPFVDTLLGFQYILYNKNGVGGRGFEYSGNSTFHWEGGSLISAFSFNDSIKTPPMIHVESPAAGDIIDASKNLRVQFNGSAGEVTILIRRKPARLPEVIIEEKPLLKLRVKMRGNGIVIPSTVLRLLPGVPEGFLFSFQVERNRITRIPGYPSDVLFSGSYVHHIVLKIKR